MVSLISDFQQEGKTHVITLEEEQPSTVDKLLSFLYIGDYDMMENATLSTQAQIHAQIHIAAQKFLIQGLKPLATLRFRKLIDSKLNVAEVLDLAEYLYDEVPESVGFYQALVRSVSARLKGVEGYMNDRKFREDILKQPRFAADVFMAAFEKDNYHKVRWLYCTDCGNDKPAACSHCDGNDLYSVET